MKTIAAMLLALAASCALVSPVSAVSEDSWTGIRTFVEANNGMRGVQVALDNAAAILREEVQASESRQMTPALMSLEPNAVFLCQLPSESNMVSQHCCGVMHSAPTTPTACACHTSHYFTHRCKFQKAMFHWFFPVIASRPVQTAHAWGARNKLW